MSSDQNGRKVWVVKLGEAEWKAAWGLGVKREALRQSKGIKQEFDKTDNGGSMDDRNGVGGVAEYALAKHLGPDHVRYWCEHQAFSHNHKAIQSDVGSNLQVRATPLSRGTLWLYTYDDHPDAPFILARVDVASRTVTFVGWVFGAEGQQAEYWDLLKWSRPAFNIPMDVLHPMEDLPPRGNCTAVNHAKLENPIVRREVANYAFRPDDPSVPPVSVRIFVVDTTGEVWMEAGPVSMPFQSAAALGEAIVQSVGAFVKLANPQPDVAPDAGPPTEGAAENAGPGEAPGTSP